MNVERRTSKMVRLFCYSGVPPFDFTAMIPLILFLLGANVGSFLNVCIWRLPRHESIAHPPSHCPTCNTRLRGIDLIPLLSQLVLRGKCRYCGAKFSWRYFGVELLTGILFLLVGLQAGNFSHEAFFSSFTGDPARLLRDLIFVATLVIVFFVDYDTKLIQLESVLLMGLAGVAYDAWQIYRGGALEGGNWFAAMLPVPLPASLLSMTVCAALLFGVREVFSRLYGKEALGFGDVLLVAAIAANLGWNATLLTFFFLAATVGAFIGVSFQIPRAIRSYKWGKARAVRYGGPTKAAMLARRAFRKVMPFGPMLAIGAMAALLYGAQINAAYMDFIAPPNAPVVASAPIAPVLRDAPA